MNDERLPIYFLFIKFYVGTRLAIDISFRENNTNLRRTELFNIPFHRTLYGSNEPVTRGLRLLNYNANNFNINNGDNK